MNKFGKSGKFGPATNGPRYFNWRQEENQEHIQEKIRKL